MGSISQPFTAQLSEVESHFIVQKSLSPTQRITKMLMGRQAPPRRHSSNVNILSIPYVPIGAR